MMYRIVIFFALHYATWCFACAQGILTFADVMRFEGIRNPVISGNGEWVAYEVWPERGDGEVRVHTVHGNPTYTIERGSSPALTHDGRWAAALVQPPFVVLQNAEKDKPRAGLALINIQTGEQRSFDEVQSFEFANNNRFLLIRHHRARELDEHAKGNRHLGLPVTIVDLHSEISNRIEFVNDSAIDSTGNYFVYGVVDTSGAQNGFYAIDLRNGLSEPVMILGNDHYLYNNFTWDHRRSTIAFTAAVLDTANNHHPGDVSILVWKAFRSDPRTIIEPDDIKSGYRLRPNNQLRWSDDGTRLFFGVMLDAMVRLDEQEKKTNALTTETLYDIDLILKDRKLDVWHWDDPLIKPNERRTWERRKNHLYTAVYHFETKNYVQLATEDLPDVTPSDNPHFVLGTSGLPYQKLITWDGRYEDVYLVHIQTGERELILQQHRFRPQLSPGGNYMAYFHVKDWFLYNTKDGTVRNLTNAIETPFENEDHDRPMTSPPYGIAGWVENDRAVLIYDKYDIWQFDTRTGNPLRLTDGREEGMIFRIIDPDPDRKWFGQREYLLLEMYHDREKHYGFYQMRIGRRGAERLLEDTVRYSFVATAEQSERILFTTERYDVFPNLWVADDTRFRNVRQITYLHEDLTERYAWGHAELVEWYNVDGRRVQGVLIYPGNYQPGKRYPVLVYFYERFSQRLHHFDHPVTNHRPVFAQYASDGYAIFLPDVWFDIPIPGYSATKNIVPGVKKLIEMGLADLDAIGLHGHSWSGYLTVYVLTQTDIFAAAIAGAPVSNMTSAYSGIRWGTGLARQFQYEQTQSRLGVSLWENRAPYIENSPVFYADRINTPLLIQFGDKDEAVPWEQGIELYLALRRLEKNAIFLQYHGEPHHLQQFANRLDYAIKMKEYFDHYLKGKPAPAWMTDGVPFLGD